MIPGRPGMVLVVDDEPAILRALDVNLRARGYEVQLAATGHQALALAARRHPDAVVLDLGLPDVTGIEVIHGLRGWSTVPIIVLSARTAEAQKVAALDAGANDYVSKPFGMDELMARLRVALRNPADTEVQPILETPDFLIDLAAKRIQRDGQDVRLTGTEWQVVELLARNPGRLVTQRQLLEEVWGLRDVKTNYVRVFMVSIRRKLEPDPSHPRYFLTEPGSGVRFVPEGRPVEEPPVEERLP
jgi:two-component system, OmpR family, KDP operon response regulator KdpE